MKQGLTSLEEAVFAAMYVKCRSDVFQTAFRDAVEAVQRFREDAGRDWRNLKPEARGIAEAIQKSVGGGE